MIYLNLKRLFDAKGIENPNQYLWKNGFTRHTVHRLLHNKTGSISFAQLEKLCVLFKCSPNELLSWYTDDQTNKAGEQFLQPLVHETNKGNINQILKQLPAGKLNDLRRFLDDLSNPSIPEA